MALNLEKVCRMRRRDSYTTDIQPTESLLMTDIVENDKVARYILEQVLHDIEHASVAFDKEKVIEELKEEGCIIDNDAGNRAVEIVEKGGVKHD